MRRFSVLVIASAACGPTVGVGGEETSGTTAGTTSSTSATATTTTTSTTTSDPTVADVTTSVESSSDSRGIVIIDDFPGGITDLGPPCRPETALRAASANAVWITQNNAGVVSKIDTVTLVEVGRYTTMPTGEGMPGNVSVSLNGDAAVTHQQGGVTAIRTDIADCLDADMTSTGPDDVLPWPDGCIAWYAPYEGVSQGAIAWTTGEIDQVECRYVDAKLWVASSNNGQEVLQYDGETGVVEQVVPIPQLESGFAVGNGAVDSEGNFWMAELGNGELVRVDAETFTVEAWTKPVHGVGVAVDIDDQVYTCSVDVSRFDYANESWQTASGVGGFGGCAFGADATMWLAADPLVAFDIEAFGAGQTIDMPDDTSGISVDFAGYIWAMYYFGQEAYRIDPESGEIDVIPGIEFPRADGDMTGAGLARVSGLL